MHIVNIRADLSPTAAASVSTGYAALGFFIEVRLCFTNWFENVKQLLCYLDNVYIVFTL